MEFRDVLSIVPVDHPDPRVQRVGFGLSDPYVEWCWGPVLGPSATILLRRLPELWKDRVPAVMTHEELSRSIGLGAGVGPHSRLMRSIDRLARHRMAEWESPGTLVVRLQVPGLAPRQLDRLPDWSRAAHERLLDAHIRALEGRTSTVGRLGEITARLDRLQRPRGLEPPVPAGPTPTPRR